MALATNRDFATATVAPLRHAFAEERKILCPFDKREGINLKEAADLVVKSESTMRSWCEHHGLGRRIGGGFWMVSKVALAMFLDGDMKALRAYHDRFRTARSWLVNPECLLLTRQFVATPVIVGNSIRLASEVELGDALG
jgi:hypothetical protein